MTGIDDLSTGGWLRRKAPACGLAVFAAAGILLAAGGCATTGDHDYDSDLPWSSPESWEGSPSIPGFDNR